MFPETGPESGQNGDGTSGSVKSRESHETIDFIGVSWLNYHLSK
jgi:hypothetical protein